MTRFQVELGDPEVASEIAESISLSGLIKMATADPDLKS